LIAAVAESDPQKNAGGNTARAFLIWTVALTATVIAVAISIMWLDHPIALWVHHGRASRGRRLEQKAIVPKADAST
jgi:hypothetical protein